MGAGHADALPHRLFRRNSFRPPFASPSGRGGARSVTERASLSPRHMSAENRMITQKEQPKLLLLLVVKKKEKKEKRGIMKNVFASYGISIAIKYEETIQTG